MLPRHYLYYSKSSQIARDLDTNGPDGSPLNHWASNQFKKLEQGDHVWLVTSEEKQLFLVGHLVVDQVLDTAGAVQYLGTDDLYEKSDYHIVASEADREFMVVVNIDELVPLLRFEGPNDRIDLSQGSGGLGQRLQTIRHLTPESVTLLEAHWYGDLDEEQNNAEGADAGGIYASGAESRREVEEAAVVFVIEALEAEGWEVESVEAEKLGYDLICIRGKEERHVEVKGKQGQEMVFVITANELEQAKNDAAFELHLVTGTLSEAPKLWVFSASELRSRFTFEVTQYVARLLE